MTGYTSRRTNSQLAPAQRNYNGFTRLPSGRIASAARRTDGQVTRNRQHLGEIVNFNPGQHDSVSKNPHRSYRDTTSEIISMYGSGFPNVHGGDGLGDGRTASMSSTVSKQHSNTRKGSGITIPRIAYKYGMDYRSPHPAQAADTASRSGYLNGRIRTVDELPQKWYSSNGTRPYAGSRRPPPLSLKNTDQNEPSLARVPVCQHYNTAPSRSRTPKAIKQTGHQNHLRENQSSAEQSVRSSSPTSIVEMYQRPSTSTGSFYTQAQQTATSYTHTDKQNHVKSDWERGTTMQQLASIPKRASSVGQLAYIPYSANPWYTSFGNSRKSSQSESVDECFSNDDDDCLREIEQVITEAIANVRGSDYEDRSSDRTADDDGLYRRIPGPRGSYSTVGPYRQPEKQHIPQRAYPNTVGPYYAFRTTPQVIEDDTISESTVELSKDPEFAEYTALLCAFERLAKSPFAGSQDGDDDNTDKGRNRTHETLDILDRIALEGSVYQRGHRRNRAALCTSIVGCSGDESTIQLPQAMDDNTIHPLELPSSPARTQTLSEGSYLMKTLPPLPLTPDPLRQPDESVRSVKEDQSDSILNVVTTKTEDANVVDKEHLKLKLRINKSTSSVNTSSGTDCIQSESDGQVQASRKRLRLKLSRTQLGQGHCRKLSTCSESSRMKQCNSLADFKSSPVLGTSVIKRQRSAESTPPAHCFMQPSLPVIDDASSRAERSSQPSDQFNLSYPPSPAKRPPGQCNRSLTSISPCMDGFRGRSDSGVSNNHRIRTKLSLFRLHRRERAGSLSPTQAQPPVTIQCELTDTENEDMEQKSTLGDGFSMHSAKRRGRVKRWAEGAARALQVYVRRTLIRSARG